MKYQGYLYILIFVLGGVTGALFVTFNDYQKRVQINDTITEIDSVYNETYEQRMQLDVYRKMAYSTYLRDSAAIASMKTVPDSIINKLLKNAKSENSIKMLSYLFSVKSNNIETIPSILPLKKSTFKAPSSYYGFRKHPITKKNKIHKGIDIPVKHGTPVYATADGRISKVNDDSFVGYGKFVNIKHRLGFETKYAHLSRVLVKNGASVRQGDVIGFSGNTGLSTGPHLHYEISKNGKTVDPAPFMTFSESKFLDSLGLVDKTFVKSDAKKVKRANKKIKEREQKMTNSKG